MEQGYPVVGPLLYMLPPLMALLCYDVARALTRHDCPILTFSAHTTMSQDKPLFFIEYPDSGVYQNAELRRMLREGNFCFPRDDHKGRKMQKPRMQT